MSPPRKTQPPVADNAPDLVQSLIADWHRERPDLNPMPMAIVGRLLRLGSQLQNRVNARLKRHDLHYSDFDVLATLRRGGAPFEQTPKALMQSVLLTSGAMTALLDRLQGRGLISRGLSRCDGRVRTAKLTAAGKRLVDTAIADRFAEAGEVVNCLTPARQAQLAATLAEIEHWLDQTNAEEPTQ